jgi:putative DNA primase/helicase
MKTPALDHPLLPLRRLVAEALDRYAAEMDEHKVNTMLNSQRAKLAEKKIAGHLKKGDQQAARAGAKSVVKKESDEPVCRRYESNDPTIEKLGVLPGQNPMGLLLFRDELVGLSSKEDAEAATQILCDLCWIRAVVETG